VSGGFMHSQQTSLASSLVLSLFALQELVPLGETSHYVLADSSHNFRVAFCVELLSEFAFVDCVGDFVGYQCDRGFVGNSNHPSIAVTTTLASANFQPVGKMVVSFEALEHIFSFLII
jgi:hypothetical protein